MISFFSRKAHNFCKLLFALFFFFCLASFKLSFASQNQQISSVIQLDYLKVTPPVYPKIARQRGWQGTVVLKAVVEQNGICKQVVVEKSSGYSVLDEAALKAVKEWEFDPPQFGGEPYAVLARVPVQFVLTDKKS